MASRLFTHDGAFELLYLASLGINARYRRSEETPALLHTLLELHPECEFKPRT
jgi:hypothetical protein